MGNIIVALTIFLSYNVLCEKYDKRHSMNDETRNKLKLLLGTDQLVDIYVKMYGPKIDIPAIKKLKSKAVSLINHRGMGGRPDVSELPPVSAQASHAVAGNESREESEASKVGLDPVFEQKGKCPACSHPNVPIYVLRAKSQTIEESKFLIPRYFGLGKYFQENYNLIQTIVCPRCFFASPDPKDFTRSSSFSDRVQNSQLLENPKLLNRIYDEKDEREAFVEALDGDDPETLFLRPRKPSVAIGAIRLAIMRAEIESEMDFLNSHFKLGSYYLKIAEIEKSEGVDNSESIDFAAEEFEIAFTSSNCSTVDVEAKSLYLLIATNIKLRNLDKAGGFLKFFKDMVNDLEEDEDITAEKKRKALIAVGNWEKKTKTLWEYRDDEDFWKDL